MILPPVLALLLAGLTTACATAMDATRDGQPVVAAEIAQINGDPQAWEGKWVRLEGRIDDKASWLQDANEDVIFLEPRTRLRADGSDPDDVVKRAVVSGQVDLTCWNVSQELNAPHLDDEGNVLMVHLMVPAELQYCSSGRANLVNVLVATLPESAK